MVEYIAYTGDKYRVVTCEAVPLDKACTSPLHQVLLPFASISEPSRKLPQSSQHPAAGIKPRGPGVRGAESPFGHKCERSCAAKKEKSTCTDVEFGLGAGFQGSTSPFGHT